MRSIYLGIDIGTSGCKAVAIDGDRRALAVSGVRYENSLVYSGLGKYDQSTQVLKDAGLRCIRELVARLDKGDKVIALGFTGQMHGLVALDENLEPVRPVMSCVDFRNEEQNSAIYEKVGGKTGLLPYTNNKMVPSCTAGKILWMQENEPELFCRVKTVVNPKDYLCAVLTGVAGTDESDASGFGVYDVKNHAWSEALCKLIGLPMSVLPPVRASDQVVGRVLPEVAAYLGTGGDTVVVAGGGDAILQTLGTGAAGDGTYSVILGTGGLISASLNACSENEGARLQIYCSAVRERWVAYVGLMSMGASVEWFKNGFYREEMQKNPSGVYTLMQSEAALIAPGSDGLVFYPTLMGQRNPVDDPFARGVMIGLSPVHTRGHIYRALLEGMVFGIRDVYDQLKPVGGPVKRIHISGGGANSDLWCQIFADVFQVQVCRVRDYAVCGALSAAVLASNRDGSSAKLEADYKNVEIDSMFVPDPGKKAVYDDLYSIYQKIYPATQSFFSDLKRLEEKYKDSRCLR